MCPCTAFFLPPTIIRRWYEYRKAFIRLFARLQSFQFDFTSSEVNLFSAAIAHNSNLTGSSRRTYPRRRTQGGRKTMFLRRKRKNENASNPSTNSCEVAQSREEWTMQAVNENHDKTPAKMCRNGTSRTACLFTRKGSKGINQDAMIVWDDFGSVGETIFCGVFDGHGPSGHFVSQNVRDCLPLKLFSHLKAANCVVAEDPSKAMEVALNREKTSILDSELEGSLADESEVFSSWKESFVTAYKLMDEELLLKAKVDCFYSGTTAVSLVKQGLNVIIGNIGDSRAVLGTKSDDDTIVAVQLTVDLKPNLPEEAERIRECNGRVFALHNEPGVHRVWLPDHNSPGLAMTRAFGDFCLRDFGIIAVPRITCHQLTQKDQFIVLATDGVWDVLSNQQVVQIVSSVSARSLAAAAVVYAAVHLWREKYPTSSVDDCSVVCLFVDNCKFDI
eukprot:c25370_g1_i1 orf=324-1661(-)